MGLLVGTIEVYSNLTIVNHIIIVTSNKNFNARVEVLSLLLILMTSTRSNIIFSRLVLTRRPVLSTYAYGLFVVHYLATSFSF